MKLTSLIDSSTHISSDCTILSPNEITCQIPSVISTKGEFSLSLVDGADNSQRLNDENILLLVILAKPVITSVTPTYTLVTSQTQQEEGEFGAAVSYKLQVDV